MKITSPLGVCARLLLLSAGLFAAQASASAAVISIDSSFSAGDGSTIYGMAFRMEGSTPTVYAADLNHGLYRGFDATTGVSTLSITTNNYTSSAGVGVGDYNPEYYLSTGDGRTMRYNPTAEAFQNVFYGPVVLYGVESSDPYAAYSDFWAVAGGTTDVVRLGYVAVQSVLQTITITGSSSLSDLAVGLNGSLYVLGDSTIYQYTTAGAFVQTFDVDPLIAHPTGIAFDTVNNSFLISNGTDMIYRMEAIPEPGVGVLAVFGMGAVLVLHRMRKSRVA